MKQVLHLLLIVLTVSSCRLTSGSGHIITQTRQTGSFSAIAVSGPLQVEVKNGTITEVVVEADDNVMKYIKTEVSGNTLKIKTENMNNFTSVHMKVYITVPELNSIHASASADVKTIDVLTNNGKILLKASSSAGIQARVDAPEIESNAHSSASIELSGKTKNHIAEASSSAEIQAYHLLSENTNANASSSADIEVHASVLLNATASSSGSVKYRGAAVVNKTENSSGSVEKKD